MSFKKFFNFRKWDLFGVSFLLRVDGFPTHKSREGGILSALFSLIIFVIIIDNLINFLTASELVVNVLKVDGQGITLNQKNFPFLLSFLQKNETHVTNVIGSEYEDLFEIKLKYVKRNISGKIETEVKRKECYDIDKTNFPNVYDDKLIENKTCFDFFESTLNGKYTDNEMTYYKLEINFNKNSEIFIQTNLTNRNKYLKELLENNTFEAYILYPDKVYDTKNFTNPVTNRIDSNSFIIAEWQYNINLNYYFNQLEYIRDNNRFFNTAEKDFHLKFSSNKDIYEPRYRRDTSTKRGRELITYYLKPDLIIERVSSKRKKATTYLSEAFSLILLIYKSFSFFIKIFNEFHGRQEIVKKTCKIDENIKEVYKNEFIELHNLTKNFEIGKLLDNKNSVIELNKNYDNKLNEENNINDSKRPFKEIENNNNELINLNLFKNSNNNFNPDLSIIDKNQNIVKKDNEDEKNLKKMIYAKNHKKKLNVSFWSFIKHHNVCFKSNNELNLISLLEKKFNYNFDVVVYLKMMNDFQVLKKILINEELQQIFNFVAMTSFSFNHTKKEKIEENIENMRQNHEYEFASIKDAFDEIKNNCNKNIPLYSKVIELLKNELDECSKE